MADETNVTAAEIEEIAERALRLQRHLLRRAWGVLYATYAVAVFLTIFGAPVVFILGFGAEYTVAVRVVVGMSGSGAALSATLWAFRRVRDTAEIRALVTEGRWKRILGFRVLVPLWVAAYVVFFLSVFVAGLSPEVLVLSLYAVFWGFLYYAMNLSFPGKLPVEGTAALSSFGMATGGSIVTYLSLGVNAVYGLLWAAMIVIWVVSAVHARRLRFPGTEEGGTA